MRGDWSERVGSREGGRERGGRREVGGKEEGGRKKEEGRKGHPLEQAQGERETR